MAAKMQYAFHNCVGLGMNLSHYAVLLRGRRHHDGRLVISYNKRWMNHQIQKTMLDTS